MQFMTMLKMREDAGAPPPDFYEAMGAYIAGIAASGKLITTGGLLPSSAGAEVRATTANGVVVTHGPFTEATELVGGYAVFEVDSRDEAVAMATEFVQLHVDHWPGWEGSSEIRQIVEPPPR
jgi:hypothetical protein